MSPLETLPAGALGAMCGLFVALVLSGRLVPRRVVEEALAAMERDDVRWEWVEAPRPLHEREPRYARGRCLHTEVVPVEAGGETVAHLCLTCDKQLPGEWQP
jgi:hypothetical protein